MATNIDDLLAMAPPSAKAAQASSGVDDLLAMTPPTKPRKIDPRFVDDTPEAPSRQFKNTGPDAAGQLRAAAEALGVAPHAVQPRDMSADPGYLTSARVAADNGAAFGFGPTVSAAQDYIASKIPGVRNFRAATMGDESIKNPDLTFDERRQAHAALLDSAREHHPLITTGAELAGSVPTMLLAPEVPALEALGPGGRAMGYGLGYGAIQGAGEATSHGKSLPEVAHDAGMSGIAGAVTGGVLGKVAGKLAGDGEKNLREWVLKDITGDTRGASTPTAKRNLQRDAEDVADLVTHDPQLESALAKAQHQNKNHLSEALKVTEDRLETAGEPRERLYSEMDPALKAGGVRSGDFRDYLASEIKARLKTGKGYDEGEARELQRILDRITKAEDWGGNKPIFDPEVKIGKERAGDLLKQYETARASSRNDSQRAAYDEAIAGVRDAATKQGYDPDHIVPSVKLRDIVTDTQKTAYDREGGLNGTERYNRAKEVAAVPEQFLRELKTEAAKKVPDVVKAIDQHDTSVSALLRIRSVLDQRLGRAEQDAMGATGDGALGRVVHTLAHPKRGIITEGIAGATRAGIAAKRGIDKGVRTLQRSDSEYLGAVLKGLRSGLPLAAAIKAAQSANHGDLKDAGDFASDVVRGSE